MTTTTYKNYDITYNLYGRKEYTVQFLGDDLFFNTKQAAKKFIDDMETVFGTFFD